MSFLAGLNQLTTFIKNFRPSAEKTIFLDKILNCPYRQTFGRFVLLDKRPSGQTQLYSRGGV